LYAGGDGSKAPVVAFPLKTADLQDQIGEGLDVVSGLPSTYNQLSSSFKLSNQNGLQQPQSTSLDGSPASPLKNTVASPIIYNQKAALEHNTP